MSHYLVIVADIREIQAFLEAEEAIPIHDNVYRISFDSFSVDILIAGWGMDVAVSTVKQWLKRSDIFYDFWINIGIAGVSSQQKALSETYSIATVKKIIDRSSFPSSYAEKNLLPSIDQSTKNLWIIDPLTPQISPRHLSIFPSASLYTASKPVNDGLNDSFELIDMEGYGLAALAKDIGVSITLIKITSDYANAAASLFIYIHLPELSEKIKKSLHQALFFLENTPCLCVH
ncbi:hypothetical protein [Chlamydiifrater volucris]|uniref:hypothetical protein n=1 Tax=Chlamydiifrater volucris TaxID=2681470 RepID=UPI001BD1A5AF|nr:hypothetical protein [Chlamydiifrater volucris]